MTTAADRLFSHRHLEIHQARHLTLQLMKWTQLFRFLFVFLYNVGPPSDVCWFISPRNYSYKML